MPPITVLLVEDDDFTREGLAAAVASDHRLKLIADAACLEEAQSLLQQHTPDILLIDLGLPDGDGTDLIRAVCGPGTATQAMVITVFGDERHVLRAIEAGASGYLIKDADIEQVAEAICQMADGQSPISPGIARHLLKRFQPEPQQAIVLTDREQQVLELVSRGASYAEIADALDISVHTARTHIRHIYAKLSVRTRGQAVYEALKLGLVPRD